MSYSIYPSIYLLIYAMMTIQYYTILNVVKHGHIIYIISNCKMIPLNLIEMIETHPTAPSSLGVMQSFVQLLSKQ